MTWVRFSLCLLLPAALIMEVAMTDSFAQESVISHDTDPDPDRQKYIWNPFPSFCGDNATIRRCAGVCPETCAFKSLKCPSFCGVNCVCNPGYVFDEDLQLCILQSDCPEDIEQEIVDTHRVFQ